MKNIIIKLIGKKITEADLNKFTQIEKDHNFHIYGQKDKNGGGFHHNIGTNKPTSNPADCNSYWTRRRTDGSYEVHATPYTEKSGEMCWIIMNNGKVIIGCILSKECIVVDYSQRILNKRGDIHGLAFYLRKNA